MLKKEKTLRTIVEDAFKQQEDERKQLTDIAEKLEFLHPKYYQKLINEMLEAEKQIELFEMLPLEGKVQFLMVLDNTNLESFLTCILQEKKETVFIEWLDKISREFSESLKNKFIELLKTMKQNEEIVLQCIPNSWMDKAVEEIMEKVVTVFSNLPENLVIQILLQCNKENFSTICEQLAGSDFFCYEDVTIENQIAFLQKLKKCNIAIDLFVPSYELIALYKEAKSNEKKIILFDIIVDMEERVQESILYEMYDIVNTQTKVDLLQMISNENDTGKFLPKRILAVRFKKMLESKNEIEEFEIKFLQHFETWLDAEK